MIYKYSDFYPFMVDNLPGCPTIEKLQKLRQAFRTLAMETESWTEELAKVNLVANQQDYVLRPTFDGLVKRIMWVEISGGQQSRLHYEVKDQRTLRWKTDWIPATSITSGLQVKIALYPDVESKTVVPDFFTLHFEGILALALNLLQDMNRTKWHNPALAAKNLAKYRKRYNVALRSKYLGQKAGGLQMNLTGRTGRSGAFA